MVVPIAISLSNRAGEFKAAWARRSGSAGRAGINGSVEIRIERSIFYTQHSNYLSTPRIYGDGSAQTVANYNTYTATVNFGKGIVTAPTSIGVITGETYGGNPVPQSQYEALLGIGANISNGPASPALALPGNLSQGVMINDTGFLGKTTSVGTMQFGPNPLPAQISVSGAPITTLDVSINGGPAQPAYNAYIDSGDRWGAVTQNEAPGITPVYDSSGYSYLPAETTISVSTPSGQGIYDATVGSQTGFAASDPFLLPAGANFNTVLFPFDDYPVYLSYSPSGVGTIAFDS